MAFVQQQAEPPLVSVLMAAYNAEAFIRSALDSLLEQTLRDIEVIVVDDASTDATAGIVEASDDPRVRLIRLPVNRGVATARNAALQAARGRFVAIMDADDRSRPQRLHVQSDILLDHPDIDVLGSQIAIVDEEGRILARRRYPLDHETIVRALPRWNPIAHPTVLARREVLLDAGGYDPSFEATEDYDLWSRLARGGRRFGNVPHTLVDYRLHPASIKTTRVRTTLRETLLVQSMHWADRRGPWDRAYRCGERVLLRLPPRVTMLGFKWVRYRLPSIVAQSRVRQLRSRKP